MKNKNTAKMTVNVDTGATVKGRPGRPSIPVTIPDKRSFTIKDLESLNPSVKSVTIRAHVLRGLENGTLTKLVKTVRTGKKGKPAFKFMNTEAIQALKAKDVERKSSKATVTA